MGTLAIRFVISMVFSFLHRFPVVVCVREVLLPPMKFDMCFVYSGQNDVQKNFDRNETEVLNELAVFVEKWYGKNKDNLYRYSIVHCAGDKLALSLIESGSDPKTLLDRIKRIREFHTEQGYNVRLGKVSFSKCFRVTTSDVFKEIGGDRQDALNVIFYVTDCRFDYIKLSQQNEFKDQVLRDLKNATIFFLCVPEKQPGQTKQIDTSRGTIASLLKVPNDSKQIVEFRTANDIREAFESVFPKVVLVQDCEFDTTFGRCQFNVNKKVCEKEKTIIVKVHPKPIEYGNACPKNEAIACPADLCRCDLNVWKVTKPCDATKCGTEGTETSIREVSHNPTCSGTQTQKCFAPTCPTTTTTPTTSTPTTSTPTTTPTTTTSTSSTTTSPSSTPPTTSSSTTIKAVLTTIQEPLSVSTDELDTTTTAVLLYESTSSGLASTMFLEVSNQASAVDTKPWEKKTVAVTSDTLTATLKKMNDSSSEHGQQEKKSFFGFVDDVLLYIIIGSGAAFVLFILSIIVACVLLFRRKKEKVFVKGNLSQIGLRKKGKHSRLAHIEPQPESNREIKADLRNTKKMRHSEYERSKSSKVGLKMTPVKHVEKSAKKSVESPLVSHSGKQSKKTVKSPSTSQSRK